MRRRLLIYLCLVCSLCSWAQETIIVGDVVSAATGEPIANASVYYQATKMGTATNDEGAFALRAQLARKQTLVISAVGYRTQRYPIEPGTMAGMQVEMEEKTTSIGELFVTPGENPALPIIAAVRAHRSENDRGLRMITSEVETSSRLYISDIGRRQLQRRLWQNLQAGMIMTPDSDYVLPLYQAQQTARLEGNTIIPANDKTERALVMSSTDYSALLTLDGNYNFYHNDISLFGHSFLSPLAASASTYYAFFLADSLVQDSSKLYVIHFRTKNPFYATFNGELIVDSATYALRGVTAQVPRETGVNYLSSVRICQHLSPSGALESESVIAILDFAVKADTSHTFPTVLIEHQMCGSGAVSASPIMVESPIPDSMFMAAMDSVEDVPLMRTAKWIATVVNTGYMPTGWYLDFGHIMEAVQFTPQETVRLGLPLRTSERLWKNLSLEAWVAYGVRDNAWKGMGRINLRLPATRRHILSAEYHDRYVWTEVSDFTKLNMENSVSLQTMDFTMFLINPLFTNQAAVSSATRQRQFQIRTENDWTKNIETSFYLRVGRMGYGNGAEGYYHLPSFPYQNVGGILRVGFGERKVDGFFRRVHVYSRYPVLYFGAEMGTFSETALQDGYHLYGRLSLKVHQSVSLGQGGTLDYTADFGYIIGKVPYPFLHHFEGNQSYAYDPYRFTLMNTCQYAADRWLSLHLAWNGQGVLFNLIPGIRYLRLRELFTFKIAYGAYSDRHLSLATVNAAYLPKVSSLSTPYVEIGCGIGNILRVLDIHSVWRLTHRDDPSTPYWAMRFRLNLAL